MKTKFVRFNKLPKIDTQTEHQYDPSNSRKEYKDSANVSNTIFRKSDGQKFGQFMEMFDGLMKKSIRQVRDFELEARDRTVLVDLPETQLDGQLDDQQLKEWLTEVCKNVFSSAFFSLSSDSMSYEHTKIFCSQGILRNIVLLTKKFRLNQKQIKIIDEHIESKIVPYMKKKYPLTETNDVNKQIDENVKPIDNREALENDLLQKSDVVFTYREDGNYNDQIMSFINWIMDSIDMKENPKQKTVYQKFYQEISSLFNNAYNQQWMKAPTNTKAIDSMKNLTEDQKNSLERIQNKPKLQCNPAEYTAEVKQYTYYAIGRKISKNVPTYSEEEINSGYLNIKSPAILRILTKWCQELWEKFTTKNYFLDRQENVRVQEKDGNINTMFMWMKLPLNDLIEQQKLKIQKFMREVQQNNYDQQAKLLLKQLQRDGFTHIERIQKACGKFAFKTISNLHRYIVLYLNRIIHGLLTVSKELYESRLSTKARWTSPPDLLSFKIGDLMRCKFSSKERQILKIFKQIQHMSNKTPKYMKIVRVKNRLKLGTNDILVNVLYKQKYLCQIQLAIKSTTSKFIQCSNLFNHYIYQLERTLFGPLTELCSVWMNLDPRSSQFSNIVKNQERHTIAEPVGCSKNNMDHRYAQLDRPFICSDCNIAYSHNNFIWQHQRCIKQNCGYMICARCRIQNEDPDELKKILLKKQSPELIKACTSIVNRKTGQDLKIPTFGVCIQIQSKKIKIQRFKQLQIKRIMSVFGIKKNKQNNQTVTLIEELIKKGAQKKFLKKYLVFQIPDETGKKLIDITIDKAKKDYIIPQKVKQVYKKEKQILSLIDENLDDQSCKIMNGKKDGMDHIINMQLADNSFTNVKFITNNFPKLQRLQLSRNKINNIDTISKLKEIQKLNLRDNQLSVLPDQICQLKQLQGLNIRNNQLKALPDNFGNLKNLNKLQSDNNMFTDLPSSFQNLINFKFIDLSSNKLTKFPVSFKNFTKLKDLALANNQLGELPTWIGQFKDLITLDLRKTKLKNFPSELYSLKNLQILKIQSSYHQLSNEIGNLTNLKDLCIQMPNISSLPQQIFKLINLQTLEIEDCKIDTLPDCLSEMSKLTTFSLINNKLQRLSNQLTEMVKLRFLRIEGQNIKSLPQQMKNLVNLRTLSLDKNLFETIPPVVANFTKLHTFSIKKNQITYIEDNFFNNLLDLQTLDLLDNKLTILPKSILNIKKLKKISCDKKLLQDKDQWKKLLSLAVEKGGKKDKLALNKLDSTTEQK